MTDASQPERHAALVVGGRILLGLIPLLLLIAVVEVTLLAFDLGEPPSLAKTSRGFDRSARYLVPDESTPGGWRTQVEGEPRLEQTFPPPGEATRVLLVGGSNTKLFPTQELQILLDEYSQLTGSTRTWEVLNIGRAGYGSQRVLTYLQQAMVLQPDVVVIYAGHNEFVEAVFAQELGREADSTTPALFDRIVDSTHALRSFNLLEEAFTHRGAGSTAWEDGDSRERDPASTKPKPWTPVIPAAFDLRPESTQRHYDAFEENLEAMCDVATGAGARVLLCTPLYNAWSSPTRLDPYRWAEFVGLTSDDMKAIGLVFHKAKMGIPPRFRDFVTDPVHLRVFGWYAASNEGLEAVPYEAPTLRTLGPPLDQAPAATGRRGGSVEGAHWPDPQEWGAITRDLMDDVAVLMRREVTPQEQQLLESSAEGFRQVVEMTHEMPQQIYSLGTVYWLLGRDEEAAACFRAARNRDSAPRAASSKIHDAIRRIAAAKDDVALLDSARIFTDADPNGIPGYEMLMDACHLQPGVRLALMYMLAKVIPQLLDN